MNQNLTPSELEIMEALWTVRKWMSIRELIDYFGRTGITWKRQTINTFLAHLIEKGLVVKNGRKYIYTFTKDEYESQKATKVLDSFYGGSLKNFVSAVSGCRTLSPEEVDSLKEYLDKHYP